MAVRYSRFGAILLGTFSASFALSSLGDVASPNPPRDLTATPNTSDGGATNSDEDKPPPPGLQPIGTRDFPLYLAPFGSVLWDSIWPALQISVCWENPSSNDERQRAIVKKAVEETWMAASDLKFVGWQQCKLFSPGIHIQIENSRPQVKTLGQFLDYKHAGMVLNFSNTNWRAMCKDNLDKCIHDSAVHEFGHALGFAHEHQRLDVPEDCKQEATGAWGDYYATVYDQDSIMNYCNGNWNNNGALSRLDKVTVRYFYTTAGDGRRF